MKRKTELYRLVIEEEKTKDTLNELNELKSDMLLKDFLNHYYDQLIFNSEVRTSGKAIVENDEEEDLSDEELKSNIDEVAMTESILSESSKVSHTKIDLKSKSICYYIDSLKKVDSEDEQIDATREITINYIKYDKKVKVVDKDTLEAIFEKGKNQGDLEKQHYILRTFENANRALIVWEKVYGAVTIGLLERHMNSSYRKWIREKYKDDKGKKIDLLKYNIKIYALPSKNFIEELEKLEKISLLNVSVKKEKITKDEDILYSEENISRDYVEISYKPSIGKTFTKKNIKKYFTNSQKNKNIKRLVIKGRRDGSSISLDTELMKMSEYVDIKLGDDGLILSEDLFKKYVDLIDENVEALNDIFIDIDISDEKA
ncbi:MAG: hypothetical protein ACRDDE_12090 [Paraclostridium sp.]|uniref:hypothetical protein n=1 Tax=Paraclostridium sp. TaxID=2023273 RepID=UPI003EE69F6E